MSRQHLSDFEIGYEYARKRYSFLAKLGTQHLWEMGNAYLRTRGTNAELSRGMGFYCLELGIKMRLAEITPAPKKEDFHINLCDLDQCLFVMRKNSSFWIRIPEFLFLLVIFGLHWILVIVVNSYFA